MKKPISPHLSIYKPQITSVFSVLHRFTGVYMFVFLILLAIILFISSKYKMYNSIREIASIYYILIVGIGCFVFCLSYHICCGIRYLIWSCKIGLNMNSARRSAIVITITSLLMTVISLNMFIG